MTACPCEDCTRPLHPGYGICTHHAWTLERALAEVAALTTELDLTLSRQTAGPPTEGGRGNERPLPFDYRSSEAAYVLRNCLVGWVRDLQPDPSLHPRDTLPALAAWLLVRRHQLVTHAAAHEAVGDVCAAVTEAWRTVDSGRRGRITLDELCPDCTGSLYAVMHEVGDPRPNVVWCDGPERHTWAPEQWLRLGHRLGYTTGGAA